MTRQYARYLTVQRREVARGVADAPPVSSILPRKARVDASARNIAGEARAATGS